MRENRTYGLTRGPGETHYWGDPGSTLHRQEALVSSADRMSEKRSTNARSAGEGIMFIRSKVYYFTTFRNE